MSEELRSYLRRLPVDRLVALHRVAKTRGAAFFRNARAMAILREEKERKERDHDASLLPDEADICRLLCRERPRGRAHIAKTISKYLVNYSRGAPYDT